MNEKVLLAVDGSENSKRAVEYAMCMKKNYPEMEITVLAVTSDDFNELEAKKVTQDVNEVFKHQNYQVNIAVNKGGDPSKTIAYYANNGPYDQVIMGSRGLSNLKGLVLGSVSHKVLHLSKKPVTIVK